MAFLPESPSLVNQMHVEALDATLNAFHWGKHKPRRMDESQNVGTLRDNECSESMVDRRHENS
jgi:hypothetical protein